MLGSVFHLDLKNSLLIFIRDYLSVMMTIIFNVLFLYLIVVVARNNRFTKYSRFHSFVLNYTFFYQLLNMVLFPALTLTFGRSLS